MQESDGGVIIIPLVSRLNSDFKKEAGGSAGVPDGRRPFLAYRRHRGFVLSAILLAASFAAPLWHLYRYAWASDLFSYILIIPPLSIFFAWSKRDYVGFDSKTLRGLSMFPLFLGVAVLAGVWWAKQHGRSFLQEDYLAAMASAFLLLFVSVCFLFLGRETLCRFSFPLFLLFFMIPLPGILQDTVTGFLQHRSADVAQVLFALSGMPLLRQDTLFRLPGFSLEVAPECSGIHSTIVLFITSLVAGYVCLRSPWRRVLLTFIVIPLALLRNGLRVFTIGQLCVNIGPHMIDSYIHRKGGPIFFALSLIPFFLILLVLWKSEKIRPRPPENGLRPQPVLP